MPERRVASDLGDNEVSFIAEADHVLYCIPVGATRPGGILARVSTSHTVAELPGFVWVVSRTEFCFPDFSGNLLFNTLGNLEADAARRTSVYRLPKRQDAAHHR